MTPPKPDAKPPPDHLTAEEIEWLRENRAFLDSQRKAAEHEAWLRGRVKVVWPWLVAIVAATVSVIDWISKHIQLKP